MAGETEMETDYVRPTVRMRFQVAPDHSASFPGTGADTPECRFDRGFVNETLHHSLPRSLMRGFPSAVSGPATD